MPCLAVIHLRGRGKVGDGDWEPNDVVQAFEARKQADGTIEANIGNVWKTELGTEGSRQYLALYLPDASRDEARAFEGRAAANIDWEPHFSARERDVILDRTRTTTFLERAGVGRRILRARVLEVR